MISNFDNIKALLDQNKIFSDNELLDYIIPSYSFHFISEEIDLIKNQEIFQYFKESKVIIINYLTGKNQTNKFFIIGFQKTVIIIDQSLLSLLNDIFNQNSHMRVYFLSEVKNIFNQYVQLQENQIMSDTNLLEDINTFNQKFKIPQDLDKEVSYLFTQILSCITGYLIEQSYLKLKSSQIQFKNNWTKEEYIELHDIGFGSSFTTKLIYIIEKEEVCLIKQLNDINNNEGNKLINREYSNYSQMNHPLLPKCYGKFKNTKYDCLLIEFINGETLDHIEKFHFSFDDKINIFIQLIVIIYYFHKHEFVYRDLKPNNIIVDENKRVFIIDFDRMLKIRDIQTDEIQTGDLGYAFVDPKIECLSYSNDIYSLGQIFYFIMNEKIPNTNVKFDENSFHKNKILQNIYLKLIQEEINQRLSIEDIVLIFFNSFQPQIKSSVIQNLSDFQYFQGITHYFLNDIEQSIHYYSLASNQNHPEAQFNLGFIYLEGKHIPQDIDKAIHYISLAAEQNHNDAQFNLGLIYYEGKYITRDINKSIHYYSLAADQKDFIAQYYLGLIYYEGKYITQDINKAIQYFTLSAKQNYSKSQYYLGLIYYEGKYTKQDINKAIHYFLHASNQNHPSAQFYIGLIYYEGEFFAQDVNKAFRYFSLSANLNDSNAQFYLGLFYYEGKYLKRNINKAIQFFSSSAKQNNQKAQFILGLIFFEDKFISRDIYKSIHYFTLAADQNHPKAPFILGFIYYEGKYVQQDIKKAIHYFTIAANNNDINALYNLGTIYYEGEFITRDINKAIQYFSLAADQKDKVSQYNLGLIYFEGKYITQDINKAINYFTLAAEQNHLNSQFNLGLIYFDGKYIAQDINKAIYYFTCAADQSHLKSLTNLGLIYYEGEYVTPDINKSIQYFTHAANLNDPNAQFFLGYIYLKCKFIPRDVSKSIKYFTLSAKQNDSNSQFFLGNIYSKDKYLSRDIKKAIYYYLLAADQNHSDAQNNIGTFYLTGKYIAQDINKAIHYYSLSAKQNNPSALYNLGLIYFSDKFIAKDIKKSLQYFTLSANQNSSKAQFILGFIYSNDTYGTKDINKSIYYLSLAANQNNSIAQFFLGSFYTNYLNKYVIKGINYFIQSASNKFAKANFPVGYFYHEGKHINRNIEKAIEYYKEASSFDDKYAKNNLGIIYKNGIGEEFPKNIGYAIEYFEESARSFKDPVSMYNLSHIYLYEDKSKKRIDESIKLLINSSDLNFYPATELLCIALIMKYDFEIENIEEELNINKEKSNQIIKIINLYGLLDKSNFEQFSNEYKTYDFLYNNSYNAFISKDLNKPKLIPLKKENNKNINKEFYEGFGKDLYQF